MERINRRMLGSREKEKRKGEKGETPGASQATTSQADTEEAYRK